MTHNQLELEQSAHAAAVHELAAARDEFADQNIELQTLTVRVDSMTDTATLLRNQLTIATNTLYLGGVRVIIRADVRLQSDTVRSRVSCR